MFCPNCGTQLPDGSRMCSQCGEVVEKELDAIAVKRQKEGWMKDFFSFRKMVSTTLIKFIYILGMIILTIGGIAMFSKGDEKILIGLGILSLETCSGVSFVRHGSCSSAYMRSLALLRRI